VELGRWWDDHHFFDEPRTSLTIVGDWCVFMFFWLFQPQLLSMLSTPFRIPFFYILVFITVQ